MDTKIDIVTVNPSKKLLNKLKSDPQFNNVIHIVQNQKEKDCSNESG